MIDEVGAAVGRGDVEWVRNRIFGASEADRRRVAAIAARLLKEVRREYISRGAGKEVLQTAQAAFLATASPGELKRAGRWGLPSDPLAIEVISGRPQAAQGLAEAIAGLPAPRWGSNFRLLRSLVRAGTVAAPTADGYVLAMINGLDSLDSTIYDALLEDPGLLDNEVWRLFEVEGGGETSLAAHDKYTPEPKSWASALTRLAAEGRLSRGRLLDSSLAALHRDFAAFRASWFARFHEALQPSAEERRAREAGYISLLGSPAAATVSFAVKALVAAGGVSEGSQERLLPALEARAMGTVSATLKLLPPTPAAAELVAAALPHATRDTRRELQAFLDRVPGTRATAKVQAPEQLGKPDAPAVVSAPARVPGPVASLEELVAALATALEEPGDPQLLERCLDGASRLCARNDDALREIAPVVKRARALLARRREAPFLGISPRADIAGLVIAWASGEPPEPAPARRSVLGFLSTRVREIAERAARGQQRPVLSLPVLPGGAIDTATLEVRRREHRRLGIEPAAADALQAALRGGEVAVPTGYRFTLRESRLDVDPAPAGDPGVLDVPVLFYAALAGRGWRRTEADYAVVSPAETSGLPEAIRWVATVWPANREIFYAKGASEIAQNIDWWEARWHSRYFLEPLLLPAEPIGPMARLLLGLALGAKDADERRLAVDAVIAAVAEGRLEVEALGGVLANLYRARVVKGPRIATAMDAISAAGRAQSAAATAMVETMVGSLEGPPPSDLAALLLTLGDGLAAGGRPAAPKAATYLESLKGSGKGAALAREILTLRPPRPAAGPATDPAR